MLEIRPGDALAEGSDPNGVDSVDAVVSGRQPVGAERPFADGFVDGSPAAAGPGLGVEGLPAGIFLAAGLAELDFDRLSGTARVEAVAALHRLVAHYQAKLLEGVASVYEAVESDFGDDLALTYQATAAELRAELRLTRRAADATVELAMVLRDRLPALHTAFMAGDLDERRVKVIVAGTEHLPPATARQAVDTVLPDAPTLTTGQLAARLRRLCIELDPHDAAARQLAATDQRRVEMRPDPAGTAHLFAFDLDPTRTAHALNRIDRIARHLNTNQEPRTIDQLRADVFLDLLCTNPHPGAEHPGSDHSGADHPGSEPQLAGTTHITIDLETLIGLTDHPGDLAGYGPVIADLARHHATEPHRRWEYSIHHPTTGHVVATGTTRRRPDTTTRRTTTSRHPTCAFPGCRAPATSCDLDHTTAWAHGGLTHPDNLAPLCRHDHTLKHALDWTYQTNPDGTHTWTTHLNRTHTTNPHPP